MEPVLTSARSTYIPSALSNTAYRNSLLGIGSDKIHNIISQSICCLHITSRNKHLFQIGSSCNNDFYQRL